MKEVLEAFRDRYPNDAELGGKIKEFINNFAEELSKCTFKKIQDWGEEKFQEAADYRVEEKKVIEKIKKKFDLK